MNTRLERQKFHYHQSVTLAGNRCWVLETSKENLRNPAYKPVSRDRSASPERRDDSVLRSKRRLEQLCYANATPFRHGFTFDKFLTLTYSGEYTERAQPHNHAQQQADFKAFIRKLKAEYPTITYIAVGELQTKNDRNALHWHLVLFNVPVGDFAHAKISAMWGMGYVWLYNIGPTNTEKTRRIGYISKYIVKGKVWHHAGNHLYQRSEKLKEPKTYYHPDNVREVFAMGWETVYRGEFKWNNKLQMSLRYAILQRKNPVIAEGAVPSEKVWYNQVTTPVIP